MMYLTSFTFPSEDEEVDYLWGNGAQGSFYPFKRLSARGLDKIEFEPITVLHGNNGSGKSTALNVIAQKMRLQRDSSFNQSTCFPDYVAMCEADIAKGIPESSRIITSDDVFDFMLNVRSLNEGLTLKREDTRKEYLDAKYSKFKVTSIADYDQLKKVTKARSKTQTQFVKSEVMGEVREYSNGENALRYFTEKITENALFLLDEPENSLSPKRQMELKRFLEDSVRFFGCQLILSTHSPFLLALQGAKVIDLEENPVRVKEWTELETVRIYREFFQALE